MQVCMDCFHELFDSDKECVKCKSKRLLTSDEYKMCKQFFISHDKDRALYGEHPYSTYLDYLRHKEQREKFEYNRLHPFAGATPHTTTKSTQVTAKPIPKCPTCQSTNIEKISTASKAVNTTIFGLLGTKRFKTFRCKNCGYEW